MQNPENEMTANGLKSLYSFLEDVEETNGFEFEFEPDVICENYKEFPDCYRAAKYLGYDAEKENLNKDIDIHDDALCWLENNATVIFCDNGDGIIVHVGDQILNNK